MYEFLDHNNISSYDAFSIVSNRVQFSKLRNLNIDIPFHNFSIKYVHSGKEIYKVNGGKYHVNQGEYLLTNSLNEGAVIIGEESFVEGVCIDLNQEIVSEVCASFLRPDTDQPDFNLDKYFTRNEFVEQKFRRDESGLFRLLNNAGSILTTSPELKREVGPDFYYQVAEQVISDYLPVAKKIMSLKSVKASTKKDLYRKVERGREYLDLNFMNKISVQEAARESGISEYHFFRLFKEMNNCSPHQYVLRKRLQLADEFIKQGMSFSEIAFIIGFSDQSAFSNAFKKYYKKSPAKYRQSFT